LKFRTTVTAAALCVTLASCAAPARRTHIAADAPLASDAPESGRIHGYVIERRYGDFQMVDGKEIRFDVEYGWDYARGTGVRKTFDTSGKLLTSEDLVNGEMSLGVVEQERVRQLVRTQPQLKAIANGPDVVIWGEGFLWRVPGDRWCDRGSRCIHAIIAKDEGLTAVGHAIVDLQTDRVVYPFYDGSKLKSSTGE